MHETLIKRLNQLPPFVCRIIARKNRGWSSMGVRELATRSGLSKSKVAMISALRSWESVSIRDAEKFAHACGVDLLHPGPHKKWLRGSGLVHIQRARLSQRRMFTKLLRSGA